MIELARHQPNAWSCGPAALRNAMLSYNYDVDVQDLAKHSVTECCKKKKLDMVRWGRCEHGLAAVADEHGFKLEHVFQGSEADAHDYLRSMLPSVPILLSVEHHSHWITGFRGTARHVWIMDPARDLSPLRQRVTYRQILRRMQYGLKTDPSYGFHFYPLVLA